MADNRIKIGAPPKYHLKLEWVYGYKAQECRNHVQFTEEGEVVYFAAKIAIVLNVAQNTQRFYFGHSQDIISLCQHAPKMLVATGQLGRKPFICIWDVRTMGTLSILKTRHENGISAIDFDRNGEFLVSVGLEVKEAIICIWSWKSGRLLASCTDSCKRIMSVQFSPHSSDAFVTVGLKSIRLWKLCGSYIQGKLGTFGENSICQTMLCVAFTAENPEVIYSGGLSGDIFIWKGGILDAVLKDVHRGGVTTIYRNSDRNFVTGGKDGCIQLWNVEFKPLSRIDLNHLSENPKLGLAIRSVYWKRDTVLVGAHNNCIYQVFTRGPRDVECIMQGGTAEKPGQKALAIHPHKHAFITGNESGILRYWDAFARRMMNQVQLSNSITSCCFNSNATHLAAGFHDGTVVILRAIDLSEMQRFHDTSQPIRVLKYSPDSVFLASGSADGQIYFYNAYKSYKKSGECSDDCSSAILHLDWSSNSHYIQANDSEKHRFVFRTADWRQVKDKGEIETIVWNSCTLVAAPEVSGFWPKYEAETSVTCTDAHLDANVIVTGNNKGHLQLYSYPSYHKGARRKLYKGHSSSIERVKFFHDKSGAISLGASDMAIFQWSFLSDALSENLIQEIRSTVQKDSITEDDDDDDDDEISDKEVEMDSDLERELQTAYHSPYRKSKEDIKSANQMQSLQQNQSPIGKGKRRPPTVGLRLESVYGFRGFDCRNNVYFVHTGIIVYHVAAVGVVYNVDTHRQAFYVHHSDDIVCLAQHPVIKSTVATGQIGKNPPIHVWDTDSLKTVSILKTEFHQVGIAAMDFSADGRLIVTIGLNDRHGIVVWNWSRGEQLATAWGHGQKILAVKWDPHEEYRFTTVGVKHLKFWSLAGAGFTMKRPIFGNLGKRETMVSVAYGKSPGFCLTGGSTGTIYQWGASVLIRTLKAHDGPVFCMSQVDHGFLTGGKDGVLQLWDDHLERCIRTFPVTKAYQTMGGRGQLVKDRPAIRACSMAQGKILAGTAHGELLLMENTGCFQVLIQGHAANGVWGFDVHPHKNKVTTMCSNETIRTWDLDLGQMMCYRNVSKPGKCVCYSPDAMIIAVGFQDGSFQILNADTLDVLELIHRRTDTEVSCMKFTPMSSTSLAVGYSDGFVDIYTQFPWRWVTVCNTKSTQVISLDWTADGELLHITTDTGSRCFAAIPSGHLEAVSVPQEKFLHWTSWTSPLGLGVQKIWTPEGHTCNGIHGVCLSKEEKLLAAIDSSGYLRLIEFPITMSNPKAKWYLGHGSNVTMARWTWNDKRLVTVNRDDSALLVWSRQFAMTERKTTYDSDETESDDLEDGYDSDVELEIKAHKDFEEARHTVQHLETDTPNSTESHSHQYIQFEHRNREIHVPRLQLDFAFGFHGCGSLNNIHYVNDGTEIVYPVAAVAVVMNTITGNQVFYTCHTDFITSLIVNQHPNYAGVVASGQLSLHPAVHVWSTYTLQPISKIKLEFGEPGGIGSLSFSGNGKLLLIAGLDADHTLTIWRWEDGRLLARCPGYRRRIFVACFRPDFNTQFVTVGVKHVKFWSLVGNQMMGQKGVINVDITDGQLEKDLGMKTMFSVSFGKNDVTFTGASNGNIYVWKEHFLQRVVVKAHMGPIYAMHLSLKDGLITTGSKQFSGCSIDEVCIKLWDPEVKRCKPFSVRCAENDVTVKCVSRCKGKILLATMDNCIHELDEKIGLIREVMQGHSHPCRILGLSCHPHKPLFATTGTDHTMRIWDIVNKRLKGQVTLEVVGSCVHFAPDGDVVAVGLRHGQIVLIGTTPLKVISKRRDTNWSISDIKVSPNNKYLSVAYDSTGRIDIYMLNHGYNLFRVGYWTAPSPMTPFKMDFSTDSALILVTNDRHENKIILASSGCPFDAESNRMTKVQWQTLSLFHPDISLPTTIRATSAGAEPLVTSSCISNNRNLIAIGDNKGNVALSPAIQYTTKHPRLQNKAHSTAITGVQFSHNDQFLVTTADSDGSIFIWRVLD